MSSSFVPYTEKVPARYSANSMAEISDTTRQAYLTDTADNTSSKRSNLNPLNWKLWQKLLAAAVLVVVIVVVIVGAVLGTKASSANNSYPAYSPLNYTIKDTYAGSDVLSMFDYFYTYDPTQGFVHYDNQEDSISRNTTYATDSQFFVQVDTKETNASTGRHSARINSKNTYADGLFVFDVAHTPYGCGTWPAIWLVDQANWPNNGEIDVIEAVNNGTTGNQMTLHTSDGCSMQNVRREETGKVLTTSCVNSTDENAGCGVQGSSSTFGPEFNAAGGGVYAMELRDDGIRTWFFSRSNIPANVNSTKPDPSTWGTALADFPNTDCNIGNHFKNLSITINVDLCGSWAGSTSVYSTQDQCPGVCSEYVALNPSAFTEAYWAINSFKVYQA